VTGGPDDGAELYPPDHEPCLVCAGVFPLDWDGVGVVWHLSRRGLGTVAGKPAHCPGSRKRLATVWLDA
jgi:hypothetical protein